MSILYFDQISPTGHKNYNQRIVDILEGKHELVLFTNSKDNLIANNKIISEKINYELNRNIKIKLIKNTIEFMKIWNKNSYSKGVFSSFEILSFSIINKFIKRKNNIFLIHHNTIDQLEKKSKLIVFKTFMNSYKHIVLSENIKEYLILKTGICANKIFVVPHPLINNINLYESNENIISALSNSNEEKFIEEFIKYLSSLKKRSLNDIVFFIKSKMNYKSNLKNVFIVNDYLKKEEYINIIQRSKYILLPFPSHYKYRISGVLLESIAMGKIVIASNTDTFKYYSNLYPGIIFTYSKMEDIMYIVNSNKSFQPEQYNLFIEDHGDKIILQRLEEAMGI